MVAVSVDVASCRCAPASCWRGFLWNRIPRVALSLHPWLASVAASRLYCCWFLDKRAEKNVYKCEGGTQGCKISALQAVKSSLFILHPSPFSLHSSLFTLHYSGTGGLITVNLAHFLQQGNCFYADVIRLGAIIGVIPCQFHLAGFIAQYGIDGGE